MVTMGTSSRDHERMHDCMRDKMIMSAAEPRARVVNASDATLEPHIGNGGLVPCDHTRRKSGCAHDHRPTERMIIMCELCHMPGITLVTPNGERCPDASGCLTRMTQRLARTAGRRGLRITPEVAARKQVFTPAA
jgi:hypothetical protein